MNKSPEFGTYPEAQKKPVYSRWWISGVVMLGACKLAWDQGSRGEPNAGYLLIPAIAAVWLLWLLIFLLRMFFYHLSVHNKRVFDERVGEIKHAWWNTHRQTVALRDAVLLGPSCSTPEQRQHLFNPGHPPPAPTATPEGLAIRLSQVFGDDVAERERELATLLALQWDQQRTPGLALQPLCCYWQGSLTAWQAFVEQMAACCPLLQLPDTPEPWQGLGSLEAIIDRLQGAPSSIRILCAGCHSSPVQPATHLLPGEAAVLWWIAPQEGVRLSRGEGFATKHEHLPEVAERALQQGELTAPTAVCVSFSQADVPDMSVMGWNTQQHRLDARFGGLADLEAMVVLALAAWYTEQHGEPCAWLASDPHYTLALGVVKPHV